MKILILFVLSILSVYAIYAQEYKFPEDWLGQYKGNMLIDSHTKTRDTVEVDFGLTEMVKDSLWSYKMVFHSDKYGMILKDYLIHIKRKGDSINYILDEKNGIEIELTLMNNCFYGMYKLDETIYSSILKRQGEGILFEIYTVTAKNPNYSVLKLEEDKSMTIESYKPHVVQSAMLLPRK